MWKNWSLCNEVLRQAIRAWQFLTLPWLKRKKKKKRGKKQDNQTGHGRALVVATRALVVAGLYWFESL